MERDASFEALLEFVRDRRGFDYTSYKRPSLVRRVEKRMGEVGVASYEDYMTYLDGHADEFGSLFDTILINVTGFFRDPEAWEYIAEEVVPKVVAEREDDPIRIWSAGCATGEEAYTAAMLFHRVIGDEGFYRRMKIYATDVDEKALGKGRHAAYSERALEQVPEAFRERYFQPVDGHYVLRSDLRRSVIFGRSDLVRDPPISRVDLLISRNTLMYFGREAQDRIIRNFFFALRRDGFLFLGKAEALQSSADLFTPANLGRRIFVKAAGALASDRPAPPRPAAEAPKTAARESGFDQSPVAQVIVDGDGLVMGVNHQARVMFAIGPRDIGRSLHDLELSYRPVELRSRIDEVYSQRRPLVVRDVLWPQAAGGEPRHLDISITPLLGGGGMEGVAIAFTDVSAYASLQGEVESTRRELEDAHEELQSTVEELETTNEELQSTNEELETTNEELQSTNEELETMNEELQSTNEELETMNDELRDRTDAALRANAYLGSILSSLDQSVVVLDSGLTVTVWSQAAAELWGLRADEAEGEHFLNLDIGLPVGELRDPIRRTLTDVSATPVTLSARDRRGRLVESTFSFSQLLTHRGEVQGVVLIAATERVHE
jgi:two-component system CheB/CheR fusion protein